MSETATPTAEVGGPDETLLRYRPGQRYIHLLVASSFTVLFLTGLPLIFEPLAFLAARGYSRIIHRIAAVGFMAVPFLYFIVDRRGAKELIVESFQYDKDDRRWLLHMGRYFLGQSEGMPPQGRLNAGQKLHHAAVLILGAGVVFSGLVLWIWSGQLTDVQLSWAALVHNISMLGLVLLLIGHIYFTVVYKAINAMHTGYVPRADAAHEHAKWVAELDALKAREPRVDPVSGAAEPPGEGRS
jgi:formate dehydrogenase subunit gamma